MEQATSQIGKLHEIKKKTKVDAFLITSAPAVTYFSGYSFYFEYGPSPFHLIPAILAVVPGGDARLILADNETGNLSDADPSITVQPYTSYTFEQAPDPTTFCLRQVIAFIKENKLESARIGIEKNHFPFVIGAILQEEFPFQIFVDCGADISALRLIKNEEEIKRIRAAAGLSDIGQQTVFEKAREGITELELFSEVHAAIEKKTGRRIPVMADLSSGILTNSGGGMPTNRKIQEGDLVLSDFQACLRGYWGDSCSTISIGRPTAEQRQIFQQVQEALHRGIDAIRPGVRAKQIDQLMRAHIGNYPHHSGHGVGTAYHEEPRITPYNEMLLEPGMIIALEPAIYKETFGIRLEHLMLVTNDGSEVLTQFKHSIEQH